MSNNSDAVKRARNKRKELMIESMGSCCQLCGFKVPEGLVFHHINPENKSISFAKIRSNNVNWGLIVEELRKCILLCANCHNIVHATGLSNYTFTSSFIEEYADIQKVEKGHLNSPKNLRYCEVCNNILRNTQVSCCSEKCRVVYQRQLKQKVNWEVELPNILRLREVDKMTYVSISKIYGVSDRTISEQLKKYKKNSDLN